MMLKERRCGTFRNLHKLKCLLAAALLLICHGTVARESPNQDLIKAIAELSTRSGPPNAYFEPKSIDGLMQRSLWQRLQTHFAFVDLEHPDIDKQISYFTSALYSLRSNLRNASPYLYFITDEIDRAGLPIDLALLPLIESAYNPHAHSNRNAVGLWQFIPATAKTFGLTVNENYDGRKDIITSTRAAIRYLQRLNEMFDGDWLLALAAYNTGPTNVRSAMTRARNNGLEPTFWNLRLARETRDYVPRIIAATKVISNAQQYGLILPDIPNRKSIDTVAVGRSLPITLIADLIEESTDKLVKLNPGFPAELIPPGGPYHITIPADKAALLVGQLNSDKLGPPTVSGDISNNSDPYPSPYLDGVGKNHNNKPDYQFKPYKKYIYHSHVVKRGESLWKISRAMGTDIDTLLEWSGEKEKPLQPGDKMIVAYLGNETPSDLSPRLLDYRVHATDSLIKISDKFRLPISVLKKWNPSLWRGNHLQTGQMIKIPLAQTAAVDTGILPEL